MARACLLLRMLADVPPPWSLQTVKPGLALRRHLRPEDDKAEHRPSERSASPGEDDTGPGDTFCALALLLVGDIPAILPHVAMYGKYAPLP